MAKKINSETPESLLKKLASSSPNDAVKLLFLDEDDILLRSNAAQAERLSSNSWISWRCFGSLIPWKRHRSRGD